MREIDQNVQEWRIKNALKACTSAKHALGQVRDCIKCYRPEERRSLIEEAARAVGAKPDYDRDWNYRQNLQDALVTVRQKLDAIEQALAQDTAGQRAPTEAAA